MLLLSSSNFDMFLMRTLKKFSHSKGDSIRNNRCHGICAD